MKTITIPDYKNPYEVEINGRKYTYPAGSIQTVPDEVAALIEDNEFNSEENPLTAQPSIAELQKTIKKTKDAVVSLASVVTNLAGTVDTLAGKVGDIPTIIWFHIEEDVVSGDLAITDASMTAADFLALPEGTPVYAFLNNASTPPATVVVEYDWSAGEFDVSATFFSESLALRADETDGWVLF